MVAYLYRMPAGIAGDINRAQQATVEAQIITPYGTTGAPPAYGLAVNIDATTGQIRIPADPDTTVYGFLARPFPINSGTDGLGTSTPPTSGICDVLKRGYMTVKLGGSTASVKGGAVYVWSSANSGAHVQGEVEAADPSTNGFIISNAYFMGPADADGNVEIAFNV